MGGNRYNSHSFSDSRERSKDGWGGGKGGKSSRLGLRLSFQKERKGSKGGGKGGKRFDTRRFHDKGKGEKGKGDKGKGRPQFSHNSLDFRDGKGEGRWIDRSKGGGKGKGKGGGEGGNPFASNSGQMDVNPIGRTGPLLGKGSELRKVHTIYARTNLGHWNAIEALTMFNEKFVSASSDQTAIIWKGDQGPKGMSIMKDNQIKFRDGCRSLYFESTAQMLFCGLDNGEIKCYQAQPLRELLLVGHKQAVTCQTSQPTPNGEGVLISGSEDGTIRFWVFNQSAACFNCTHQLDSHCGPVFSIQVVGEALWIGGERGISCLNLVTLELAGKIECKSPICGPLLLFEGHIVASFRDGAIAIYDPQGKETYKHEPQGEHQSNTASGLMMHPCGIPLILCGQKEGYVTAYELPSFAARGSFIAVDGSDVTSILDLKAEGLFVVGGAYGDVTVWKWEGK